MADGELALGDQKYGLSGSLVSYGRGIVIVTSTGMKLNLENCFSSRGYKRKSTPLQVSLDNFGKNFQ